jgi:hypothetical protein
VEAQKNDRGIATGLCTHQAITMKNGFEQSNGKHNQAALFPGPWTSRNYTVDAGD